VRSDADIQDSVTVALSGLRVSVAPFAFRCGTIKFPFRSWSDGAQIILQLRLIRRHEFLIVPRLLERASRSEKSRARALLRQTMRCAHLDIFEAPKNGPDLVRATSL